MIFVDYALQYLIESRANVKVSTAAQYEYLIHKLTPYIGQDELSSFDTQRIQRLADALVSDGMSKRSVTNLIIFTRMILRNAMRAHVIPIINFDKIRNRGLKTYNDRPCITDGEFDLLVDYCQNNPETRGANAVLLALYAGLRIGEIAALKWSDISFPRNSITVNRTRQRIYSYTQKSTVVDGTPKSTTSHRNIPMAIKLRQALENYRTKHPKITFVASLLPNGTEPRQIRLHMEKIMIKAGIEKINPHALRHTFISRAINRGGNVKAVSEIAGHADAKITLNIYTHASEASKQQAIACLDM